MNIIQILERYATCIKSLLQCTSIKIFLLMHAFKAAHYKVII